MLKSIALAAMLTSAPALGLAQGVAPNALVCDGSEMRHAEHTRTVGRAMFASTAAARLVAILTIPRDPAGVATARSDGSRAGIRRRRDEERRGRRGLRGVRGERQRTVRRCQSLRRVRFDAPPLGGSRQLDPVWWPQ